MEFEKIYKKNDVIDVYKSSYENIVDLEDVIPKKVLAYTHKVIFKDFKKDIKIAKREYYKELRVIKGSFIKRIFDKLFLSKYKILNLKLDALLMAQSDEYLPYIEIDEKNENQI